MMIPFVSYNDILNDAKALYTSAAIGESDILSDDATKKFFDKARRINPSVAKMSLQQAQNDIFTKFTEDYLEDRLTEKDYKIVKKNIYMTTFNLNRCSDLIELDKRVRDLYKDTGRKRLAIISCLLDGEELGLANVKLQKGMKRFQYIMRCILNR